MARLFEHPGFARYWTADATSMFGTYISAVAFPVLTVITLQAPESEVGLVTGARFTPYLLFGLLAGVFSDRYRRRPILIGTNLGSFVVLSTLVLVILAEGLTILVLMGFAAVLGTLAVFREAADQSYLPRLVPSEALMPANARIQLTDTIAQTTGPFLGGAVIRAIGIPLAVMVDALSYLVAAVLLTSIRKPEPAVVPERRNLKAELRDGLRWVYRHPVLAPYALTLHGRFLCGGFAGTVFMLLVFRGIEPGLPDKEAAFRYGIVLAIGGIGAVAGNWLSHRVTRFGTGPVIIAGRLGEPMAWILAATAVSGVGGWVMVAASQLFVWFAMYQAGPHDMAYRQAVTPDHLQGRMNATIRSLNWGTMTIGAPLGGLAAEWIGYRQSLWVAIGGMLLFALLATFSPLRTARHPEPVLQPAT